MAQSKQVRISEQVFDDPVTGLTYQFEAMPDGTARLRLFGDALEFGNREFIFDSQGMLGATGTATAGDCRPTWSLDVDRL